MRKHKKHHFKKIGMPPGSLVHIGEIKLEKPIISLIEYDAVDMSERVLTSVEMASFRLENYKNVNKKVWLNIHGVNDAALIKLVGDLFHLHPLVQEDILNTEQRPKLDEFDDYLFIETRSFNYEKDTMSVVPSKLAWYLGVIFC
jgi:magnesium transporter